MRKVLFLALLSLTLLASCAGLDAFLTPQSSSPGVPPLSPAQQMLVDAKNSGLLPVSWTEIALAALTVLQGGYIAVRGTQNKAVTTTHKTTIQDLLKQIEDMNSSTSSESTSPPPSSTASAS